MIAGFLRWVDVDPRRRPAVDEAAIVGIVRPLVAAAAKAKGPRYRDALFEAIERELLIELGPWVDGWTWPTASWACGPHALFPRAADPAGGPRTDLADADDDPVTATTARVVRSVMDWARSLDVLATLFDELRAEARLPGPEDGEREAIEIGVERAASRVLPWVLERTHAEDAWYDIFAEVLAWYVESAGHDAEASEQAISRTIRGKFESWVEPTAEVARATCASLGVAIADLAESTEATDATAAWLADRRGMGQPLPQLVQVPVRADGHQRFIETRDRARDGERAERMSAALLLCRDSAQRGMALTFDQMCEWQAAVLGESRVEFRSGTAYANGGRKVYPLHANTRRLFETALRDAAGGGRLEVRAARVYLDVCFFHPFADGNARAARLALDHVLTSAGYALHVAEPAFIVSRSSQDRLVGWSLASALVRLIGPIGY